MLDLLGYSWPEADEDKLAECGQAWLEFAVQVGLTDGRGGAAAGEVVSVSSGDAVGRFAEAWGDFSGGPGSYFADAQIAANVVGIAFEVAAAAVLLAKVEVIVQLVVLAVELIAAQAAAPFTLGLSEVGALGVTQATRLIGRRLLDELKGKVVEAVTKAMAEAAEKGVKKIASDLVRGQVKNFAVDYARKAVRDVVIDPAKEKATEIVTGAGQNLVQQGVEARFGARKGIDVREVVGGAKEEFGEQFGVVENGAFKPGEYIAGQQDGHGGREGGLAGLADPATHRDRVVDDVRESGGNAVAAKVRAGVQRARGEGGGEGRGDATGCAGSSGGDVRAVFG
ncbi:PE-PGRS family protein [Streptomyces sp. NPDC007100]|uniref:WXG100-like domain-containing protein n=1 Tax=Streptomyces sp. NPDC007100 TaxID=3155602 RepID=UPI0033FF1AD3